jgi:hypothetical protein
MSKKEIQSIKERNMRVDLDKAWETSISRRSIIVVITYGIVVLFLYSIHAANPWLSALVPCAGYVFSTLGLSFFKKYWARNIYGKRCEKTR